MDMTNKQIRITRTITSAMPNRTTVDVDVLEDLGNGTRRIDSGYEFVFDEVYQGPSDPLLLATIVERLTSV